MLFISTRNVVMKRSIVISTMLNTGESLIAVFADLPNITGIKDSIGDNNNIADFNEKS